MLSIIIPSINRSEFLIRLLKYFYKIECKHLIYIGDSSNLYHFSQTKEAIKLLRYRLKVIQMNHNGLNDWESTISILIQVETKYCVFFPDDNFIVPENMTKCIQFLELNTDYVAAHGIGVTILLKNEGPYGQIKRINYYPQPIIETNTATTRLINYLKSYSVAMFSVFRFFEHISLLK